VKTCTNRCLIEGAHAAGVFNNEASVKLWLKRTQERRRVVTRDRQTDLGRRGDRRADRADGRPRVAVIRGDRTGHHRACAYQHELRRERLDGSREVRLSSSGSHSPPGNCAADCRRPHYVNAPTADKTVSSRALRMAAIRQIRAYRPQSELAAVIAVGEAQTAPGTPASAPAAVGTISQMTMIARSLALTTWALLIGGSTIGGRNRNNWSR
jgi:hypothetical protein